MVGSLSTLWHLIMAANAAPVEGDRLLDDAAAQHVVERCLLRDCDECSLVACMAHTVSDHVWKAVASDMEGAVYDLSHAIVAALLEAPHHRRTREIALDEALAEWRSRMAASRR